MHIKKILRPLLLLSFATGLYSPIKAAVSSLDDQKSNTPLPQQNGEKAVQIHVLFTDKPQDQQADTLKIQQTVSVRVLLDKQKRPSIEERMDIINQLITQVTEASQKQNNYGCILMELPQECITKENFKVLGYWFDILKDKTLRQYTKLLITGEGSEETKKGLLTPCVKNKELFFAVYARDMDKIILRDEKIIYAASLGAAKEKINKASLLIDIEAVVKQVLEKKLPPHKIQLQGQNRGYLVFSFSVNGCACSFVSAEENSEPEFIGEGPISNINELKTSVTAYLNKQSGKKQRYAIVLKFSTDDILENNFDKHLPHFIEAFGAQSLNHSSTI